MHGLHVDLVRAPEQLDAVVAGARPDLVLSLGVIDGRNVWRADLDAILDRIEPVVASGRSVIVAPSCSLLHSPIDLERETALDPEVKDWLAFAVQKVAELAVLAKALNEGRDSVRARSRCRLGRGRRRAARRPGSTIPRSRRAPAPRSRRWRAGHPPSRPGGRSSARSCNCRAYPTTTIGSFPQTPEVRKARADHGKGAIDDAAYDSFLREETERAVRWQEEVGLDVLVHGEFERNDMVQYFGEQLSGFAFTKHAWVQSYGSRCVRPPIIYGDVSRPEADDGRMVALCAVADRPADEGHADRPGHDPQLVVRPRRPAAQPRPAGRSPSRSATRSWTWKRPARRSSRSTRRRCARACRCGTANGRPISTGRSNASASPPPACGTRRRSTPTCATRSSTTSSPRSARWTPMSSRSRPRARRWNCSMRSPATATRPRSGPGVYDIHSPRVPAVDEMAALLKAAAGRLPADQLWVNPDCGLKTRKWPEVTTAIENMVAAARVARA